MDQARLYTLNRGYNGGSGLNCCSESFGSAFKLYRHYAKVGVRKGW
jgi:hypothetical protein